jgi:hypothetical protein
MGEFGATLRIVKREWDSVVNGSAVTTVLVIAAAVFGILAAAVTGFPTWPAIVLGGSTLAFAVVSLPFAAVQVAHRERLARIAAEDRSKPRLAIRIDRLSVQSDNGVIVQQPCFVALLCVTNEGHDGAPRKWQALITLDGDPKGVTKLKPGTDYFEAVVWFNIFDWSSDPPRGDGLLYKVASDVAESQSHMIQRGATPEWIFVGHLPYDGITLEDLKTLTIQCEDFQGTTYFSVLPPGNIDLGKVHLR